MSDEIEWREATAGEYYGTGGPRRYTYVPGRDQGQYEVGTLNPQVPTEKGFYEDKDGDVWWCNGSGDWQIKQFDRFDEPDDVTDSGVEDYLPLIPLRLERV